MGFVMSGANQDEIWPLVRDYHYSSRLPSNIQHCYAIRKAGGLFGDTGEPVAAIIFSWAQAKWAEPVLELSRLVRHPTYKRPLSEFISFASGWLRRSGHSLVISYADWTQKHHGGIYQAAGWHYSGMRERDWAGLMVNGVFVHGRSCNAAWGTRSPTKLKTILPDANIKLVMDEGKYLYWKDLTIAGRSKSKKIGLIKMQYPKPNAARPLDKTLPSVASEVQPLGAAPFSQSMEQ